MAHLCGYEAQAPRARNQAIQATLAELLAQYLSVAEVVGYSSDEFQSASPETFIGEIKRTAKIFYATRNSISACKKDKHA